MLVLNFLKNIRFIIKNNYIKIFIFSVVLFYFPNLLCFSRKYKIQINIQLNNLINISDSKSYKIEILFN